MLEKENKDAEITALIVRDFELADPNKPLDESAMLAYLSEVISYMIENKLDYLLSLLYRLDVDERKINRALLPGNPTPANEALAKLVWERQKQRVETKRLYREQNPSKWNWDIEN